MGVDGIKPKTTASTGPTVEAKKIEAPKVQTPPAPVVAKKPSEGFDVLKKKIMSVSGRYVAPPAQESQRTDLKELIAKQRSAVQAGGAAETKSGTIEIKRAADSGDVDTIASKGKDPGPRPEASDFTARRDTRPISKADAEALKKKGYVEASAGRAIEGLKKKNPVSGKEMMNAIASAPSGFKDVKAYVTRPEVWKTLSPEAKANYKIYEGEALKAQKAGHKEIPKADFATMVGKMENATARAALEKDFGVKVKDGVNAGVFLEPNDPRAVKTWSTEELMRAHESFANMPTADQAKLKGIDLIRDAKAPPESQAEMGKDGIVAGEYMPNVEAKGGHREIHLYDGAFPDQAATSEARKDSISVITHEAGHAVEGRDMADKLAGYNVAAGAEKAQNVNVEAARQELNDAIGSKPKGAKQFPDGSYNHAMDDLGRSSRDPKKIEFLKKQQAVEKAITNLQNAPADKIDDAKARLKTAQGARDTAAQGFPGAKTDEAIRTSNKVGEGTAKWADENAKLTPLTEAKTARFKEFQKLGTLVDKKVKVMVDGQEVTKTVKVPESKELEAFKAARSKGGKTEGAVSPYGKKEGAEEYAEAYALYQRDPAYMAKNFPKQYGYFHKNHHNAQDVD